MIFCLRYKSVVSTRRSNIYLKQDTQTKRPCPREGSNRSQSHLRFLSDHESGGSTKNYIANIKKESVTVHHHMSYFRFLNSRYRYDCMSIAIWCNSISCVRGTRGVLHEVLSVHLSYGRGFYSPPPYFGQWPFSYNSKT